MSGDNSPSVGHIQGHGAGVQGHKLGSLPSRTWFRGVAGSGESRAFSENRWELMKLQRVTSPLLLFYFPAKWCWESAYVCYQRLVVSLEVSFFRAENLFWVLFHCKPSCINSCFSVQEGICRSQASSRNNSFILNQKRVKNQCFPVDKIWVFSLLIGALKHLIAYWADTMILHYNGVLTCFCCYCSEKNADSFQQLRKRREKCPGVFSSDKLETDFL